MTAHSGQWPLCMSSASAPEVTAPILPSELPGRPRKASVKADRHRYNVVPRRWWFCSVWRRAFPRGSALQFQGPHMLGPTGSSPGSPRFHDMGCLRLEIEMIEKHRIGNKQLLHSKLVCISQFISGSFTIISKFVNEHLFTSSSVFVQSVFYIDLQAGPYR